MMSVRVVGPSPTVNSARLLLGVVLEYMDRERELREGDNVVREKLLVRSETLPRFQHFGGIPLSNIYARMTQSRKYKATRVVPKADPLPYLHGNVEVYRMLTDACCLKWSYCSCIDCFKAGVV